jgi:hypothetical protein
MLSQEGLAAPNHGAAFFCFRPVSPPDCDVALA